MDQLNNTFNPFGVFEFSCYRADGSLRWKDTAKNAVVDDGLDDILDKYFRAGTNHAGAAVGLVTGPATLANADTHASHAGWTEFTSYAVNAQTDTRAIWSDTGNTAGTGVVDPGPAASQQLVNPSLLDFDISGAGTVAGSFLVMGVLGAPGSVGATEANLKGSTSATPLLWAHALFTGGDQVVGGGDILRVTYRVTAARP